ncbi:DNA repair protein endonuclease SAE2/CtIP C-terminus-domain-containing protein [Cladorrhinum sp. PSN332]|nr:DNA repair protein endonuclease SAE2/CtIP C-terminus-domain-containing protein [Cladorrhinum sp. PSN332]
MDAWVLRGRPSLFAALEGVCESIEEDLAKSIDLAEHIKHSFLESQVKHWKQVAGHTQSVERENRVLQEELSDARRKLEQSTPNARKDAYRSRLPLADVSPNQAAGRWVAAARLAPDERAPGTQDKDWERECMKITHKYTMLNDRYEKLAQKAREFRTDKDGWLKYAEVLEKKVQRLEKKLQENETSTTAAGGAGPDDAIGDATLHGRTVLAASFVSNPEASSGPGDTGNGAPVADLGPRRAASMPETDVSQNQGRVGEPSVDGNRESDELPSMPPNLRNQQAVKIKEEPSSDEPIVVSEKNLRKRKHTDDEHEMPPPSRKIKSDPHASSDPVVTGEGTTFSPHESIDLDDDQVEVPTPRKQRPSWMQTLRGEEEFTPGPRTGNVSRSLFARPLIDTPPITPTLGSDIAGRSVATAQPRSKMANALRGSEWTLNVGVTGVAEDNSEVFDFPEPPVALNVSRAPPSSKVNRLQTLLNQLTPQSEVTPLRPARTGIYATRPSLEAMESPLEARQRVKAPAKNDAQVTPASRQRQGNDGSSKQTPRRLRETPLAQLKASDFKVNPKFNNGYKFAFDEVVRNKADRAELEGCTDYNCCGRHYRALAESELSATGPTALSRVEDIKMMEEFLGGGAYKLTDMTREERKEVWTRAKSQSLANRLGKHRHRFARQASPPGYWNPDFPSTQEIEENREESARRERKQIEERWREAMKTGGAGKWLFRDE